MATKSRKYKKSSCHKTKSAATKKAKSMRNSGMTAQVRESAKGVYCVYSAGKRRVGIIKKTGQRISGTYKRKTKRRRKRA